MRNPLHSEAEAFRFLIAVIVAAVLIVIGSAIDVWVGVAVTIAALVGLVWWLKQEPIPGVADPLPRVASSSPPGAHRILVVANETVGGEALMETLAGLAQPSTEVLVVAPALTSRVRHWTSDVDGARSDAEERVRASVERLSAQGFAARGEVGDHDPLVAIEDALRTFGADEIVISTHPPGRSHWLEQDIVEHARERFTPPVTHVVVDLGA
jgi:hypothetical protein